MICAFFLCFFLWYDLCFFLWYDLCFFLCFFLWYDLWSRAEKSTKKNTKKSTKNHGDLDNFFENLGWGAGSDEVGSRERQGEEPGAMGGEPEARVEQGARANLDLALILQPV